MKKINMCIFIEDYLKQQPKVDSTYAPLFSYKRKCFFFNFLNSSEMHNCMQIIQYSFN